jgi:hypothetical protein
MVNLTTGKKLAGPDWRPIEWTTIHEERWTKIEHVYESLSTDALKTKYLKQPIGEEDKSHQVRVELASMGNDLKEAVQSNAGLMSEYDIIEESPETLEESKSNIDRQGNSLNQYIVKVAASVLKNECVLLGCHLEEKQKVKKAGDRLPYFSCIDIPTRVFSPRLEMIDGEKKLTRISIRSDEEVDAGGFELENKEIYWVYSLASNLADPSAPRVATVQKYERIDKNGDIEATGEAKVLTGAKGEALTRLPFVWLGIDPESEIGSPGMPPFFSMAEKMIRLFNLESELDSIQRKVNIPMLTYEHMGAVPAEPKDVVLGPDRVLHHAKDTKSPSFAEPSGSSMTISEQRIQALKAEIRTEREKFLGVANQTATAALLDAGQVQMSIQTIAHSIESAFEEMFKLWALLSDRTYQDGDSAGGIRISLKFLKPPVNYQDVLTLSPMYELGVLQDVYEVRAKAMEIGYLTADIIEDAEKMREELSSKPLMINLEKMTEQNGKEVVLG